MLADKRRIKWAWHREGCGYVYVIAYDTAKILKIGYSADYPSNTVVSVNSRFRKLVGDSQKGIMVWHNAGTLEDEVIIQALCNKAYGAAFPSSTRVSEWVNYSDLDETLQRIQRAYEFARSYT